jgi:hypothetical protein
MTGKTHSYNTAFKSYQQSYVVKQKELAKEMINLAHEFF